MSSHPADPSAGDRPPGTTHPVHVGYLVAGLVLLGVSGIWALLSAGAVDSRQTSWLLPLVLVVAGVIGLVAFAAKGMSTRRAVRATAYDDPSLDDGPGEAASEDDRSTEDTTRLDDLH